MLFSLALVQAHSLVPHHHHEDAQTALHHNEAHQIGEHHELAPHDEAFLGLDLKFKSIAFDLAIPILPSEVIVCGGSFEGPVKVASRPDHPPVHGPPRPHDSRGPPASPVA